MSKLNLWNAINNKKMNPDIYRIVHESDNKVCSVYIGDVLVSDIIPFEETAIIFEKGIINASDIELDVFIKSAYDPYPGDALAHSTNGKWYVITKLHSVEQDTYTSINGVFINHTDFVPVDIYEETSVVFMSEVDTNSVYGSTIKKIVHDPKTSVYIYVFDFEYVIIGA